MGFAVAPVRGTAAVTDAGAAAGAPTPGAVGYGPRIVPGELGVAGAWVGGEAVAPKGGGGVGTTDGSARGVGSGSSDGSGKLVIVSALSQPPLSGSSSQRPNFGAPDLSSVAAAAPGRACGTEGDTAGGRGEPTFAAPASGGAARGGAGAAGACGLVGPAVRAGATPRASRDSLTALASLILDARATGDVAKARGSDFVAGFRQPTAPARAFGDAIEGALDEARDMTPKRTSTSTKAPRVADEVGRDA